MQSWHVVFFVVWASVMGSYLYFSLVVAPSAVRRWADEEGYQLIRRRNARALQWFTNSSGSGQAIYRVAVRNKAGTVRTGLAIVGNPYWFSLSVDRCPFDIRWDRDEPGPKAGDRSGLWDREIDR